MYNAGIKKIKVFWLKKKSVLQVCLTTEVHLSSQSAGEKKKQSTKFINIIDR